MLDYIKARLAERTTKQGLWVSLLAAVLAVRPDWSLYVAALQSAISTYYGVTKG